MSALIGRPALLDVVWLLDQGYESALSGKSAHPCGLARHLPSNNSIPRVFGTTVTWTIAYRGEVYAVFIRQ